MATSDQKRRAKMAKKQAKDRQRRAEQLQKQQMQASMAGKMQMASNGEIVACGLVGSEGMYTLLFARRAAQGQVAAIMLLLDTCLLGVKDVIARFESPSELQELLTDFREQDMQELTPGQAKGLVDGAIAYAQQFGLQPHSDYRKAEPLWGDVEAESIEGLYSFGMEGRPTYIIGMESPARRQAILSQLDKVCGPGGYRLIDRDSAGPLAEDGDEDRPDIALEGPHYSRYQI